MPIYEYRCQGCRRKVSLLVRGSSATLVCPHCGSGELTRLFSTFALRRTDKDIYEDVLSDQRLIQAMESNDPKALVEWNRRMSRGMDTEEVGPEHQEMLERMEAGEMPQESENGEGEDLE